VTVPVATGPAAYAKLGARNAMSRAVCGVLVALDLVQRRGSIALVAVAPTPVRAAAAEEGLATAAAWDSPADLPAETVDGLKRLAAQAAAPRDDRRGSAEYKRHAVSVLTGRALIRAWRGRREPAWA
jgi:CO/xanthine dehydrogenase FAD-binding subunit